MKEANTTSIDGCTIAGKISGDRICLKTRAGNARWLKKDAPVHKRGRFFDALFDDMVFAGSNAPYPNIRYY